VADELVDTRIAYWRVQKYSGLSLEAVRTEKEKNLQQKCEQLLKVKASTRKLKQQAKTNKQGLKELDESIEKEKKNLPANFNYNLKMTDSGVLSLQTRGKPIEEIETEIERIRKEASQL
jgi:hypothetical protein